MVTAASEGKASLISRDVDRFFNRQYMELSNINIFVKGGKHTVTVLVDVMRGKRNF